jgi:hypothetical protein
MAHVGTFVSDITAMRSLPFSRRRGFRSTLSDTSSLRVEVCPPSLRHAPASPWQRLMCWLVAPATQDCAPPLNRLPAVRDDFLDRLADVQVEGAQALRLRVDSARSLRELWHLRTEVYRLVALQYSQGEAEQRLALLNHHFPTRAPRSGFAVLAS